MSELLHYEGEDPEILTNVEEGESSESKKDKDDRIKKLLEQATLQHEHMVLNSWRLHLARESTITFDDALNIEYIESDYFLFVQKNVGVRAPHLIW